MNILYHLTVLPPKMPQAEALSQELSHLRAKFGGDLNYLNSNISSPIYIPRLLFGFHQLRQIWVREGQVSVHHVYNPDPFPFPILRWFRRPVVYTISSGVRDQRPNVRFLARLAAVAVPDERSAERLRGWGLDNVVFLPPGIDTSRFTHQPLPLNGKITLMMGSAPWTAAQFKSKGVDALLEAAQRDLRLHLIFLWRGEQYEAMLKRVAQANLSQQVTVRNRQVEVNQILGQVHASIVLAEQVGIVKSYPHSLLDSLAAGKPVLVSRAIPMADYVQRTGCGQVVPSVTADSVLEAVEQLRQTYRAAVEVARGVGQADFALHHTFEAHADLYASAIRRFG